MTPADIQAMVAHLQAAGLTGCDLTTGGATLRLRLGPQPHERPAAPAAPSAPSAPAGTLVHAPHTGIFRARHPLAPEPVRSAVAGQVVAYLQVDQVLSAVVAPCAGQVSVLAADGALVGFGYPLLRIS